MGATVIHLSDIAALYETKTLPIDEAFLETLFIRMAGEALEQALEADFGAGADPATVEEYLRTFDEGMAAQDMTPAQFLGVPGASREMVVHNARLLALRDAAIDHLLAAPETVDSLFADPATLTEVCVRHILVETGEEAEEIRGRLEAGEDFAAVADEVSLDTGTPGGDLGCRAAGGYVPEFAAAAVEAPLDDLVGPVETQYGFHLLIVSERTTPTRDDYLADPRAVLSGEEIGEIWTEWFNGVLQSVDAWVAERYGTWTPIGIRAPQADAPGTSPAE